MLHDSMRRHLLRVGPVGLRVRRVGEEVMVGLNEMDGAEVVGTAIRRGKDNRY